ncbi:MAG: hypothetical protein CM15mP102_16900 [Flavobacteriales bacterium]|nr:MAG: hypothetical protein CM15mP102_16900 [Flavobacteriales bacterium]
MVTWPQVYQQKVRVGINKPDFSILVYPVITMDYNNQTWTFKSLFGDNPNKEIIYRYSNDLNVNKDTPPTILFILMMIWELHPKTVLNIILL